MRRVVVGALLALATVVWGGGAFAADCDKPGRGANLMPLTTAGKVDHSFILKLLEAPAVKDALLSEAEVRGLPRSCERGGFHSDDGRRYLVFGNRNEEGLPPRYAMRADGKGPVLYLIPITMGGKPLWLVAITEGDIAALAAGADGQPTDDQVLSLFASTLAGEYAKGGGLNLRTGATVLFTPPTTAPRSAASAPTPSPGSGPGQPLVLDAADGTVFVATPNGGMRHALTGMICPTEIAGFKRDRAVIFDATGGGRDVSCRFSIGRSFMTLYLTRYPQSMPAPDVFDTYSRSARTVAPAVRETAAPLEAGLAPLPAFEDFWVGTQGQVDGLWMVQIGQWYIKVRATYEPEDEAAIRAAAEALFKQVHASVRPPEI